MSEFENRVALVTGGSRGIGRAIALRLAEAGADVAISYATRRGPADETAAQIRALGRKAYVAACNVGNHEEVLKIVEGARRELGPIDYLAHCGAISNIADHNQLSYDIWQETIQVNLTGAYSAVFAVKDEMIERGFGRIVVISSIAALRPRKMQIHYASAKAGVIAMTRCCAEAFAPHNVRINCIAPGLIETEMADVLTEEMKKTVIAGTPMGRLGKPEEIAEFAYFLLSELSSFTTGQTMVASGGRVTIP
ncbi:MAG: SDR family oxidoreductase [Planctomycetaceae bacterium]|nr:SDR family oxidoreductase [Planctomycetaceae bacterium]